MILIFIYLETYFVSGLAASNQKRRILFEKPLAEKADQKNDVLENIFFTESTM